MANDKRIDPRQQFAPRILPWLLAVAGFIIYALTVNHWASLFNRAIVAKISGWTWQPEIYSPVFFVATYPFHWLPAAQIPIALNLFAAACAAVTLGLLARSVAILPRDRTEAQREREHSVFAFLTLRSGWLPPVLAVLVCGLQMTFWEQATNCTGEMFDLLLLAFVIWSLLEYRLDEREGRLFLAAAVFGAGMTDNWAVIGFLPLFVGAVIWIRGFSFFRLRFVRGMILCGLAGMLFYLLLPLVASLSHKVPVTFWQALKLNLAAQWGMVKLFFVQPEVRKTLILLSPASLLPVLMLSIRWNLTGAGGDVSKTSLALTNLMFHLIHAVLLFLCVWVAFDPPFSPRQLGHNMPYLAFYYTTFYFLGALSVGYYSGYFLLVFGKQPRERSRRSRPEPFQFVNRGVIACVWLFAAIVVTGLAYKNIPQIRNVNDDTFQKYAALAMETLPPTGAILLSDDPLRTFFIQSELARDGRAKKFVVVDTASLPVPAYHHFLHRQHPNLWPDTINAIEETNGVSPLHLLSLLATLAKTNSLYYLHPSYGYFFEYFCMEPHGLVYKLNILPDKTLRPPLPDKNLIAANQSFWQRAQPALDPILQTITPDETNVTDSVGERLLKRFHIVREPNPNASVAGIFYSRDLDFWGVQLQRADDLKAAATQFALAKKLNPDNLVAQINLDFNQRLQAGQAVPVDLSKATSDQFGKYRSWNELLNENGPFDEPSFCFEDGIILMRNRLSRQAIEPFERVRQLAPDNLNARLWLAQACIASRLPDSALAALREPLEQPEKFSVNETNSPQLNILAAAAYFQKDDNARGIHLMEAEIARQPTNQFLLTTATQVYLKRGLFTNALAIIDHQLQIAPDNPAWLFGKGYASMQTKDYNEAITAFTHLLSIQSTNHDALFNRAVANLLSGRLDAAHADYEKLGQTFTNSFQVAYGLGEIAWRKHDTNEAIKNYELYLRTANTNTAEATNIIARLKSLKR
jgi:tetratricopeptide (TPR) repeat protein